MPKITKCGGSHHGKDPRDVYVSRNTAATTNQSRYQLCDLTARTQHFCANPVEARSLVDELKAAGHTLRKNPSLMERPTGQTMVPLRGKPRVPLQKGPGPAASKMLQDLFAGKLPGANIGIDITFTVNGKPIKLK